MIQTSLAPRIIALPPWLPDHVRERLAGKPVSVRLPKAVRLRLRSPEKIRVSEWAERYRVVSDGAHVGPWRHEYAPHTVKIMDTFGKSHVREVWFCGVEQSGKTNTMLNCLGWCVDCSPGNIFYLMPTEDTAGKITGGKLRPTLQRSHRLAGYLTARQDDNSLSRIILRHGMTIYPAWANSPSAMATFTAKHCFGDEVDKYPPMAGKEADPITLIKKRNRTYKGRYKRFFASTPAGLFVYQGMRKCHQVWEYRVRCPECDQLVKMDSDHLALPADATADNADRLQVGYACNECGTIWDDRQRDAAIRRGCWVCVHGEELPRPAKVGFHHRAWECLDISLAEIAAAWLKAKDGDLAARVAWANGYEAVDYVAEQAGAIDVERVVKFASAIPRDLVPPGTAMLGLVVDTQQVGFYYELWAYGYAPEIAMHLVAHGQVESFVDLEGMLARSWSDHDGKEYRIAGGLIDSGGTRRGWQKHSRTVEVYEWCSRNRIIRPHKGQPGRAGELVAYKNVETYPGTTKKITGGLVRCNLRVDLFKDELENRLGKEPGDPGAISFHAGVDEHFAKHFTAEVKDDAGDWTHDRKKGRNDYFDCAVYGLAWRHIMKNRVPVMPGEAQSAPKRRIISKGVRT